MKRFSEDIQMEFGRDKCTKCTYQLKGKPMKTDHIKIGLETTIQQLENEASHKYLSRIGPTNMSQTNVQNNRQRIPT